MFSASGAVWMIVALLLGGCSPLLFEAFTQPMSAQGPRVVAADEDPSSKCIPKEEGEPLTSAKLLEAGHAYLQNNPSSYHAQQAIYCFNRALRSVPESYEAQLGLGIAFLTKAKHMSGTDPKIVEERMGLLFGARTTLGRAYSVRHGSYDPLYYLSEVALMEGQLSIAQLFLETLQKAGVKEGPVQMLLGRLREREGKDQEAREHYERAYALGWPVEVVAYAKEKLQQKTFNLLKSVWKMRKLVITKMEISP